jgi:hypothetical protein
MKSIALTLAAFLALTTVALAEGYGSTDKATDTDAVMEDLAKAEKHAGEAEKKEGEVVEELGRVEEELAKGSGK